MKLTIHTTGQINYVPEGGNREETRIPPIYTLDEPYLFFYLALRDLQRLQYVNKGTTLRDEDTIVRYEGSAFGVFFIITDTTDNSLDFEPQLQLNFELYKIIFAFDTLLENKGRIFRSDSGLVRNLHEDFLPRVNSDEAELGFRRTLHGENVPPFRYDEGSYLLYSSVPMRIPPILEVEFDRPDLSIEQVSWSDARIRHKVKFWIRDKGGRNKKDDLRLHILRSFLHAEL